MSVISNCNSPSRRRFLRSSLITGGSLAALPALSAAREIAVSPGSEGQPKRFELDEVTIADLQA